MKKQFIYIFLILFLILSLNFFLFQILINDNDNSFPINNCLKSIVEVKASTEDVGTSFGTAEFINSNGILITNAHVITYKKFGLSYTFDDISIRFSSENDYRKVLIVKFDIDKDIAVLQLDNTDCAYNALQIGDSSKLNYNQKVFAVGNLNNLGLSVTSGIISNPNMNVIYENNTKNVIQCDLTIADGNSGGALLDEDGKLIGITTFRLRDNKSNVIYGISYCIPINTVMEYIEND